jgi:molybdate transport system substrate-binding protein
MAHALMTRLLAAGLALLIAGAAAAQTTVFAAASLKTALDEIAGLYEAETGEEATVSYAGSSALARQILLGAPADVFVSASPEWMDEVEAQGRVRPGSRVDLLGNRLALIAHGAAAPVEISPALDLPALLDGGRLAMALVDAVPAGQYGKAALTSLGLWEGVADRVAQADNVRAALALVAVGAAPLGIVYATDASAEPRVTLLGVFPEESHPPILYPAAAIGPGEAGAAFLAFLQSEEARAVFARHGFAPLTE